MLYFKFELIPIKFGFFMNFSSCSKIGLKTLYYNIIVQGISSKMATREISIFIIFSDTYTCPYVVFQI